MYSCVGVFVRGRIAREECNKTEEVRCGESDGGDDGQGVTTSAICGYILPVEKYGVEDSSVCVCVCRELCGGGEGVWGRCVSVSVCVSLCVCVSVPSQILASNS